VGELDLIEQQAISTTSTQQPWGTDVASIERRITVEEGALPTSLPPASAYASTGAQQQSPEPRAFMHSASIPTAPSVSAVTGAPRAGTLVMGDTCVPFLSSPEAGETHGGVGERDLDSLAFGVTENSGGKRPAWFDVAEARSKVLRVLEELSEFYSVHRGACDRWLPSVPMGEVDTAEDLKQHLMLCRPRWAGEWHVALAKSPSLWRRVQLMKLRHMGQRRLYVVIYSLDLLHRLLVLHVPVGPFDLSHARLQGTYRDDRFGRFANGLRIRDEILELLEPEEREFGMQYRDGGGYPFAHTDLPKPSRTGLVGRTTGHTISIMLTKACWTWNASLTVGIWKGHCSTRHALSIRKEGYTMRASINIDPFSMLQRQGSMEQSCHWIARMWLCRTW
jgi:hypothetical protein